MELVIYPLLSTCSKRAMIRRKKKWGHPSRYIPRHNLVQRLKRETGMSETEIYNQVARERAWLIQHRKYFL